MWRTFFGHDHEKKNFFDNVDSHELFFQSRKANYIHWVSEKFLYCLITASLWSVLVLVWPPQYHSPGQTGTIVYPRILSYYLCPYYDRFIYGEIQREKRLYTIPLYGIRMWCPFQIVFFRFSSYTVTKIYDRNTGTSNTAEYDCERIVDAHLRLYTEIVILDLGCFIFSLSLFVKSYIM